ncbi:MAG: hypothetical protein HYZ15_04965 [Sphingobacteriales bacterium]|nr:hypothetical protein [Sphingobacteriales bacterium]
MKKMLVLILVLLVSGALPAQGSRKAFNRNSLLSLHAGPSFPMGVFSSSMPSTDEAGYARTGITVGMNYEYRFKNSAGIGGTVFYSQYNTRDLVLNFDFGEGTQTVTMTMDNWRMYGIALGPTLNFAPVKNVSAGVHIMGGIANVRMPAFYYDNEEAVKADWGISPVVQGGLDLKLDAGKQFFFFVNGEYQYMKPVFNMFDIWTDESDKGYQKIAVVNATAGIGFRF